jgi:hypothetical protein
MGPAQGEDTVILLGHARDIGPFASANGLLDGLLGQAVEWRHASQTLVDHHAKRELVALLVVLAVFVELGSLVKPSNVKKN